MIHPRVDSLHEGGQQTDQRQDGKPLSPLVTHLVLLHLSLPPPSSRSHFARTSLPRSYSCSPRVQPSPAQPPYSAPHTHSERDGLLQRPESVPPSSPPLPYSLCSFSGRLWHVRLRLRSHGHPEPQSPHHHLLAHHADARASHRSACESPSRRGIRKAEREVGRLLRPSWRCKARVRSQSLELSPPLSVRCSSVTQR